MRAGRGVGLQIGEVLEVFEALQFGEELGATERVEQRPAGRRSRRWWWRRRRCAPRAGVGLRLRSWRRRPVDASRRPSGRRRRSAAACTGRRVSPRGRRTRPCRDPVSTRASRSTWSGDRAPSASAAAVWGIVRNARARRTSAAAVLGAIEASRASRAAGERDPSVAHRWRWSQAEISLARAAANRDVWRWMVTTASSRSSSERSWGSTSSSVVIAASSSSDTVPIATLYRTTVRPSTPRVKKSRRKPCSVALWRGVDPPAVNHHRPLPISADTRPSTRAPPTARSVGGCRPRRCRRPRLARTGGEERAAGRRPGPHRQRMSGACGQNSDQDGRRLVASKL